MLLYGLKALEDAIDQWVKDGQGDLIAMERENGSKIHGVRGPDHIENPWETIGEDKSNIA